MPAGEDEGVLLVPKAGEMLYQLNNPPEGPKGVPHARGRLDLHAMEAALGSRS